VFPKYRVFLCLPVEGRIAALKAYPLVNSPRGVIPVNGELVKPGRKNSEYYFLHKRVNHQGYFLWQYDFFPRFARFLHELLVCSSGFCQVRT